MSPKKIVAKSLEQRLDIIAVCDHNTAENGGVVLKEGDRQGVTVLPGMEKVHQLDGICISSHVDRPSYSLIGQLGFIPEDLHLDAVEVSYRVSLDKAPTEIAGIADYPCVTFSDAHFLSDIGKVWTEFVMATPTLEEIQMALAGTKGRKIINDIE